MKKKKNNNKGTVEIVSVEVQEEVQLIHPKISRQEGAQSLLQNIKTLRDR